MLKWVQAARGLYNKLRSGTYSTAGGKPKPIHFDTRKLPLCPRPHSRRKGIAPGRERACKAICLERLKYDVGLDVSSSGPGLRWENPSSSPYLPQPGITPCASNSAAIVLQILAEPPKERASARSYGRRQKRPSTCRHTTLADS